MQLAAMDKNSDHKKRRVTHSQEQRVLLTSRVVSLSSRSTNVTADEWLLSPHSHGYTRSRSHNGYVCHYRAPHFHPQSPQLGPPTNINQRTPCRMHRVPPPPPRPPPPTTRPPPLGKVGVKHDTGKGTCIETTGKGMPGKSIRIGKYCMRHHGMHGGTFDIVSIL